MSDDSIWQERDPEDGTDPVKPNWSASRQFGNWQLFGASRRGKSHAHAGTYREDAFAFATVNRGKGEGWWAIAVADGAGSCRLSRVGAKLAVQKVLQSLRRTDFRKLTEMEGMKKAASLAVTSLDQEAKQRGCDIRDLSTTLLVVLFVSQLGDIAFTFQAGDGLIAWTDELGNLKSLAEPDGGTFAGEAHFLTGEYVRDTWDSRFGASYFTESPAGLLVMSDGVADDLHPYEKNGPIIVQELFGIRDVEDAGIALIDVLGYEKRGSFDDRTLVCALRRDKRFLDTQESSSHEASETVNDAAEPEHSEESDR